MHIQKSVLLHCLSVLACLPLHEGALKCGIKGITEPCIGDIDPRYDTDVSYDLKSLNKYYENYSGLLVTTDYKYGPDLLPILSAPVQGYESMGNFSQFPITVFGNTTVTGSRIQFSFYEVMKNVDPYKPGLITRVEGYFISSFEKNGQALWFGPKGFASGTKFVPSEDGNILTPSSNVTAEMFGTATIEAFNAEVIIQVSWLADGKQTLRMETIYAIATTALGESTRTTFSSTRSEGVIVTDKNEWLQQMDAALTDATRISSPKYQTHYPNR